MIKGIDKWLPGYLVSRRRRPGGGRGPRHLMFCVADHFEPFSRSVGPEAALDRVARWVHEYPAVFSGIEDADGRGPQHTFFYPAEEYRPEWISLLCELVAKGHGEVEVHLHHRGDTQEGLAKTLLEFKTHLRTDHGLLGEDDSGNIRYGFVHGNWALCNSLPNGDWCGVNEELTVLQKTGCYADFTFPSAPSPSQPHMVNAIYRAKDTPCRPRGHDRGGRVRTYSTADRNDLMIIEGPLALDWGRRKLGILPRLETGTLDESNPATPHRLELWIKQGIGVFGRPEWIFVKVHTHGCLPGNRRVVLGEPMRSVHEYLANRYNDGRAWKLHYVTAREIYNIIRAAEDGEGDDPGLYRDFEIKPPPMRWHV